MSLTQKLKCVFWTVCSVRDSFTHSERWVTDQAVQTLQRQMPGSRRSLMKDCVLKHANDAIIVQQRQREELLLRFCQNWDTLTSTTWKSCSISSHKQIAILSRFALTETVRCQQQDDCCCMCVWLPSLSSWMFVIRKWWSYWEENTKTRHGKEHLCAVTPA